MNIPKMTGFNAEENEETNIQNINKPIFIKLFFEIKKTINKFMLIKNQ